MAAQPVKTLPEGPEWLYELKGYRALLIKDGQHIEIRSRNYKNLTATYPRIAAAALRLKADQAVVDGEFVALDASGRPSFQACTPADVHSRTFRTRAQAAGAAVSPRIRWAKCSGSSWSSLLRSGSRNGRPRAAYGLPPFSVCATISRRGR